MSLSVFEWRTGQPSIMCVIPKTQAEFSMVRRERRKKEAPTFGSSTVPLAKRMDMEAVRAYRMAGHTWDECAANFGCCVKSLIRRVTEQYPELRRMRFGKKQGRAPVPMNVELIISMVLAGESLRAVALKSGVEHTTLRHRLMQSKEGMKAIAVARARARPNESGQSCWFTAMGDKAREVIANSLSTGCEAAANSLLSCESTGK